MDIKQVKPKTQTLAVDGTFGPFGPYDGTQVSMIAQAAAAGAITGSLAIEASLDVDDADGWGSVGTMSVAGAGPKSVDDLVLSAGYRFYRAKLTGLSAATTCKFSLQVTA